MPTAPRYRADASAFHATFPPSTVLVLPYSLCQSRSRGPKPGIVTAVGGKRRAKFFHPCFFRPQSTSKTNHSNHTTTRTTTPHPPPSQPSPIYLISPHLVEPILGNSLGLREKRCQELGRLIAAVRRDRRSLRGTPVTIVRIVIGSPSSSPACGGRQPAFLEKPGVSLDLSP